MEATNIFKSTINNFLDKKATDDPLFAALYAKENKNIDECCNFILSEVQHSGCNGFSDEEIFGMAIHYYDEDNIKNINPVNVRVVVNHNVLTEEDKKTAHENAIKKYEYSELKKIEGYHKRRLDKKTEKSDKNEVKQLSLF